MVPRSAVFGRTVNDTMRNATDHRLASSALVATNPTTSAWPPYDTVSR